jgi:DNA-binding XRE family transcriptional regulator
MRETKRKKLEKAGWKVSDAHEFLELTPEESTYIELKLRLAADVQSRRKEKGLTQSRLAELMNSSQSRVAKMEAGDPSVSLDLLIRSLLVLGASQKDLGKVVGSNQDAKAG